MMLPYGRRLCVYWRPSTLRVRFERFCGSRLLWLGPVLIVVYVVRVSWVDLDAKIERAYQRRQRRER